MGKNIVDIIKFFFLGMKYYKKVHDIKSWFERPKNEKKIINPNRNSYELLKDLLKYRKKLRFLILGTV